MMAELGFKTAPFTYSPLTTNVHSMEKVWVSLWLKRIFFKGGKYKLTVFSSIRTCSSTPSSKKMSLTSLITSSITDLYNLGFQLKIKNVLNKTINFSHIKMYNTSHKFKVIQ